MKRLLLIASTAVMLGIGARPSAAVVLYPWCVQYGSIASGTLSCGFTSFQPAGVAPPIVKIGNTFLKSPGSESWPQEKR